MRRNILLSILTICLSTSAFANTPIFKYWVPYGKNAITTSGYEFNFVLGQNDTAYTDCLEDNQGDQGTVTTMALNLATDTWGSVGNAISSVFIYGGSSLAIDPIAANASPFISYGIVTANGYSIYVDQLVNGQWVHVGNAPVATGWVWTGGHALVVADQDGVAVPYVLYEDADTATYYVEKYNGKSWVTVGNIPQTGTADAGSRLVLDNNGNLFLLMDDSIDNTIEVMEFSGNSWQQVGPTITLSEWLHEPSIAINPITDAPYIAYVNSDLSVSVVGFNAATDQWQKVGSFVRRYPIDFGFAQRASLAFSSTGNPYLAFWGCLLNKKAEFEYYNFVMHLDSNGHWASVANYSHASSATEAVSSLALDQNNIPFFSYVTAGDNGELDTLN